MIEGGLPEAIRRYAYRRNVSRLGGKIQVFVLGNQKTGSTVIAASLAQACGKSVTLDSKQSIRHPQWKVLLSQGVGSFDAHLYRCRREFHAEIVKEPGLTLFYPELRERFPEARFVLIVRHPLDNIRSILNRLDIPGDLDEMRSRDFPVLANNAAWKVNFDGGWQGLDTTHYVEVLAHRWTMAARQFLENPEGLELLRYEDFLQNKVAEIEKLCVRVGLIPKNTIDEYVEKQFQPKGEAVVDYPGFYGAENYRRISRICAGAASELGYSLEDI
jgi:hypothetical protein